MIHFTEEDLRQIQTLGIKPEKIEADLDLFRKGFPYTHLIRPCCFGDGIHTISEEESANYLNLHAEAAQEGRFIKMVPASGAATRMFAFLQNALLSESEIIRKNLKPESPEKKELIRFIDHLARFPFIDELESVMARVGLDLNEEIQCDRYQNILRYLLYPEGLNFANLPKALIPFHRYSDHIRTAMEEHLVEAIHTVCDRNQNVRVHFTLSPEHDRIFRDKLEAVLPKYHQNIYHFDISYSYQLPSSQTIAVDENNKPVRDNRGCLVFRPSGHGTLIHNLNALRGDLVYIKNIDNVVPDRLKSTTYQYKKILAGFLIRVERQIHHYLRTLEQPSIADTLLEECRNWIRQTFFTDPFSTNDVTPSERIYELKTFLSRPLRVCGMVKNQGEPGGGPFWVRDKNGRESCQIVEKHQVDLNNAEQRQIWESSTHFNPVDLVCSLRDHQNRPYDLTRFIDPDTGFISIKYKDGRTVKALEVPGLWNGAMAGWNTLFVEVPLITFNPVKTVNDLLRPEHQME